MVDTLEVQRTKGRLALHAFVVMPDHVHLPITPAPEVSLEKALQFVKGGFSFRLKSAFDVWERGHFDRRMPDRSAYDACIAYIHRNPVAARLVGSENAYRFSPAVRPFEIDPMPRWLEEGAQG
jgi:putative transposase